MARYTEFPHEKFLETLREEERKAVSTDGVGFLIAAPLENGCVVPTSSYLPVHVFYPTEQLGPVPVLLHAEFLVKSDRTAIIPIENNPFNAWVADRLADYVCKFVNESYRPEAPSRHAALLVSFRERVSHPLANALWQRMAEKVQTDLRLADVQGKQRLTLGEARLISVSVRPDLARTLLEATSVRGQLLHSSFDKGNEARYALRELGCNEIRDQDLMTAIAENALSAAGNKDWVWSCWEWLAAWVAEKPYYDEEHKKRIAQVKALPVIPVGEKLLRCSDLAGHIVTWKSGTGVGNLPDWLPLTFVEDWFRDRIQSQAEPKSLTKQLSRELGIEEPGADVIQRAVGLAIEQYWKDKQGDPGRFLRFILEQDWHETAEALPQLRRCPVPVRDGTWAETEKAYFGNEWRNTILDNLYAGIATVAWVADATKGTDKEKLRRVLEWLGVAHYPRIVEECGRSWIWQLPKGCDQWKQYLVRATDYEGRHVQQVATVSALDHIAIENLDAGRAVLLIRLIAKNWEAYYCSCAAVYAEGRSSRRRYDRQWEVKAKWWWEICDRLSLPTRDECADRIVLSALWLPDKRTERAIGDLLPVVDLDAFGDDKEVVRNWLINAVGLRTRMEQLTVEEWKELLSTRIPSKAPAECLISDELRRDKVTKWYEACLETVAEQENIAQKAFASYPLLCVKAGSWKYVDTETELRYLNDDNDLATAFAQDIWLFHILPRLHSDAVKYFGVLSLSQSVKADVTPGEPQSPLPNELNIRFSESLPYVWAWRSSQSEQDTEGLLNRLKCLKVQVVPTLKASLSLGGVHHEVERRWHVEGNTIYLHKDHQNEAELALALAKALDVRLEADFYENLLRCADDSQRKKKLLSKGIPDAEIDRCLRQYQESPPDRPPASPPPTVPPSPAVLPTTPIQKPLRLKNPSTAGVVVGGPRGVPGAIGGGTGGGGTGQEGPLLTEEERGKLEAVGIKFAVGELEKMGYSVAKMRPDNPGFDLLAKKDNEELHVEVKAHSGRATVAELTHREYLEYFLQQKQGYRWELWNVEHLAEDDTNQVAITRYAEIPEEALEARTFRVDLKKCRGPDAAQPQRGDKGRVTWA